MIVDFHTHIFPDKIAETTIGMLSSRSNTVPCTNATMTGLSDSMKKSGVTLSIIVPVVTNPDKTGKINDVAAKTNEKTKETGIFSFGGIHPDTPNYKEELTRIKNLGLKGIKLHPDYYGVMFDDIRIMRIIDKAAELGLVIVTHSGVDIGLPQKVHCTPDMVLRVMKEVKPEKLVLAHMGGWMMWEEVMDKLADLPVYFDTAFSIGKINWVDKNIKSDFHMLTDEEFVNMVRRHGSDKILFATDSPWADQKEYAELISKMPLTEEEKEKIYYKNAVKLLGIDSV